MKRSAPSKIREMVEREGLTRGEVAKTLGVTVGYVYVALYRESRRTGRPPLPKTRRLARDGT